MEQGQQFWLANSCFWFYAENGESVYHLLTGSNHSKEWPQRMEDQECSRGSRSGRDEKSGLLCLSLAQGLYPGTWCTVLSLHFDPVRFFVYFKCDICCHLSRTYGRAISVTRLAGAPIKMTIARFAMKNSLFCTISSGWQPEKLRLGEEVVHSKPGSDTKFSPLELNMVMVILQIEALQHHLRNLFDWQSVEQKCPTVVMVAQA